MDEPRFSLHRIPWTALIAALLLFLLGLSAIARGDELYQLGEYAPRQRLWAALGIGAFVIAAIWPYQRLKWSAYAIYGVSLLLLIVVFFMPAKNYAHRWIPLGFMNFQPSDNLMGTFKNCNRLNRHNTARLEFNSLYGKKAKGFWFYSAFLNFKTQMSKGYVYSKDSNGKEIRDEYTNFLSPANLSFGPGMLWKKSDNFKINLAPATAKIVIVDKDFTLPNDAYFGVEEGKSTRFELGFNASAYAKVGLFENVTMENILNLYANYLEDPQNVDLDYTMNIVMAINKHMSANITFQTIYDDNAFKGFQVREVFGLGVNFGF